MAIPSNLLPINTAIVDGTESLDVDSVVQQVSDIRVPSNLIPINASQISSSFQSLAGKLPTELNIEIPQYAILNQTVPDTMFLSGSLDAIQDQTLITAQRAINLLRVTRPTFSLPNLVPSFTPKLPTFGQIKNFIKTKIDRIKRQRQQASIKALKDELKQRENPFTYRKALVNRVQKNTVLGSLNNIRNRNIRG